MHFGRHFVHCCALLIDDYVYQVCQRVDLYGFAPWTKGSGHSKDSMPYHYFDRVSGVTEVHSFPLAFKVFKLMGQHANLTIAAS